jgi:hypothetical protein
MLKPRAVLPQSQISGDADGLRPPRECRHGHGPRAGRIRDETRTMTILWIVTLAFTFGTLGVVAYGIVRALTRPPVEHHLEPSTVDAGWRASWYTS